MRCDLKYIPPWRSHKHSSAHPPFRKGGATVAGVNLKSRKSFLYPLKGEGEVFLDIKIFLEVFKHHD